jgi:hypothetical protein
MVDSRISLCSNTHSSTTEGSPACASSKTANRHGTAYAICGTTSLDDTVMVCEITHHDIHAGGKTIRLKDSRRINATGWITEQAA